MKAWESREVFKAQSPPCAHLACVRSCDHRAAYCARMIEAANGEAITPVVHYVGFRDDRYLNAFRVFRGPAFIHRQWDLRAKREIADCDTVVFANGEWTQAPHKFNGADIDEGV